MNILGKNRMVYFLAISFPLIFLLFIGVKRVIEHFPLYDDAYNATVAKNLAAGFGYATSYDSIILFNPEVTTGPSLILPAAFLIKLLGNKYWIPALSTLIITFSLLFVIIWLIIFFLVENSKITLRKQDWIFLSLTTMLVILLWTPDIREIELLGELPSGLFVCAGMLTIFLPNNKNRNSFLGGCLLGLAMMSKIVAVILVIPIFFLWLIFNFYDAKQKTIFRAKLPPLLLFLGINLPITLFEFWKLSTLGFEKFFTNILDEVNFLRMAGSGIDEILTINGDATKYLFNNFQSHLQELQSSPNGIFRFYVYLVLLLIIIFVSIIKIKKRVSFSTLERLAITSLLSTTVYMTWWFFLSSSAWYRHAYPAIVVMSLVIIISTYALLHKWALPSLTLIILLWIIFYPTIWSGVFEKPRIPTEIIRATKETSDYLSKEKEKGRVLLGCGWWANRRLEYFMPGALNFHNCFSGTLRGSALVIDREFWNMEGSQSYVEIENQCSQPVLDVYPFQIFDCN